MGEFDLNDFDELGDNLNVEIDGRKLKKLVDDNVVTAEDIANAPIYIECPHCKHSQLLAGDDCEKCGKNYDDRTPQREDNV